MITIDHNLSSDTAKSSFHCTAISLLQFPTSSNAGVDHSTVHKFESASGSSCDIVLPISYSAVPPCISPKLCFDVRLPCLLIDTSTRLTEYGWLTKVQENFKEDTEEVNIT